METKDIALFAMLISAANFILTWGVAFYMYWANRDKVTNSRITLLQADFDNKLDNHADRIARLETHAKESPTHADMSSLHEKINSVRADVSGIAGRLDGIDASLRQISNLILSRGLQ